MCVTRGSQALPWVKAWTKVLTTPKWLALPIEERGVFDYLCRLGGVSGRRGFIEGAEAEIAAAINVSPELLARTVEKLSQKPFESLKRRRAGLLITGWDEYNPPSNYDPEVQSIRGSLGGRPRNPMVSEDRKPMVSDLRNPTGEREREKEKEEEKTLSELREVRGWPNDPDTNAEFIAKLSRDFPTVNLATLAGKFHAWVLDHPFKANSSPRAQFRNWCVNDVRYAARDGARSSPSPADLPDMDTQLARRAEGKRAV